MNQAICTRGVEGGVMAFFFGSWSHLVYIPVIPDYTERLLELNAGLKMFVRAHLRLGMNQRSRFFVIVLNQLVRDFKRTPNSGVSVCPPTGLVLVVPGALAFFSSFEPRGRRACRSRVACSTGIKQNL